MTGRPRPAPLHRVFGLAWLMTRAFTRGRANAVSAYPFCLLIALISGAMGQLYESEDGHGVVIFGRHRLWLEALIAGVIFLLGMTLVFVMIPVIGPAPVAVVSSLVGLAFVLGIAQLAPGAQSTTPVGAETPAGDRWQVGGLAQRPGTRLSALVLARRLIGSAPTGTVIVAGAADDQLLTAYERFGFTRGRSKRVYLIAP